MSHATAHPLADQKVVLERGPYAGREIVIEDWWDRVAGRSWMDCDGNPVCLKYAVMSVGAPIDNEVIYGKFGGFGELVHATWLADCAVAA